MYGAATKCAVHAFVAFSLNFLDISFREFFQEEERVLSFFKYVSPKRSIHQVEQNKLHI